PLPSENHNSEFTKSTSRTSTPVRETGRSGGAGKHHSGRVSVSALSSPYLPHSHNYNQFMNQYTLKRTIFGRDPTAEDLSEHREHTGTMREPKDCEMQHSSNSFSELQACRK